MTTVRGWSSRIEYWGDIDAPIVFFPHAWLDSSATFRFVADSLKTSCMSLHPISADHRHLGDALPVHGPVARHQGLERQRAEVIGAHVAQGVAVAAEGVPMVSQ